VIGDKVLVNQLHNKKVYNKIKSKAANEVFEIKAIKGSMITVFSCDREFTRRSTRVSRPIERYIAEPASGMRNRQPKRK
jgi:hypothetical protein